MQHSHCSYCGTAYPAGTGWPRSCVGCGEMTWLNPLPVAVVMLPVDTDDGRGLLVVRRDIEPCRGELALPGGYIEIGESWREAAVRELREEANIVADAADVRLFDVHSTRGPTLSIFGALPPQPANQLPPSTRTEEATGYEIALHPMRLAFPTHTQAMADYFASA